MAKPNDGNIVKRQPNYIDNLSFDEETGLRMVELAGTDGAGVYRVKVSSDGTISTRELDAYDYVAATYPSATTEVYTYKTGGSSGTTVKTITVVYTDSGKGTLSSVTRT